MTVKLESDRLVDAYLSALTDAAKALSAGRRDELVTEMTSHIAEARAAGATSEAEIRQMLQQLGDPDDIVAAATDGLVQVNRFRVRDVAALILIAVGPFLLGIGWLVGLFLLWTSDRWNRVEKVVATLICPAAYGVALAIDTFSGGRIPEPTRWPLIMLVSLVPLAVMFRLFQTARPGRSS